MLPLLPAPCEGAFACCAPHTGEWESCPGPRVAFAMRPQQHLLRCEHRLPAISLHKGRRSSSGSPRMLPRSSGGLRGGTGGLARGEGGIRSGAAFVGRRRPLVCGWGALARGRPAGALLLQGQLSCGATGAPAGRRSLSFDMSSLGPARFNYGVIVVPQQQTYVIERFGKFEEILQAGIAFRLPFVYQIAYVHSLKERAMHVEKQQAITADNVNITIDGVVYIKITDPKAASYGVTDPVFAVTQLAQTTMRSELGKMKLDSCLQERDSINANIVASINRAAKEWVSRVDCPLVLVLLD